MAYSRVVAEGDGTTTQFTVNFALDYLLETDVTCRVGTEVDGVGDPIYRTVTFLSTNLLEVGGTAPGNGVQIVFERTVDKSALRVDFSNGDQLDEDNLMIAQKQAMMAVHEVLDGRFATFTEDLDAGGFSLVNIRAPVAPGDSVNKAYVDANNGAATLAAVEAVAATVAVDAATSVTSASNAAASASDAAGQVDLAAAQVTLATGQVTLADTAAAAAIAAQSATEDLLATVGNPLSKTANLSDLDDVPTARTNLDVPGLSTSNTFTKQQIATLQSLTDGASVSWDCSLGQKAKVVIAGNRTMAAVTGAVEGTTYFLWVVQDATGSRTLAYTTTGAGSFDFGAVGVPTLTTAASKADLLCFEAVSIAGTLKLRYCGIAKGFA